MPTLADMAEALQAVVDGGSLHPQDASNILKTLQWLQRHEQDVRAIAAVRKEFPDAKVVPTERPDGYFEVSHGPDDRDPD